MKIVKNSCYGGFGLSPKALKRLAELRGQECYFFKGGMSTPYEEVSLEEAGTSILVSAFTVKNPNEILKKEEGWGPEINKHYNERYLSIHLDSRPEDRTDPLLIQVVEELGQEASGSYALLEVVEIPDDLVWEIDEYDGVETIREKGRSW